MPVKDKCLEKLTYFDDQALRDDSEKDLGTEVFFPRENEDRRH